MKLLKGHVMTRYRPEASMALGFIAEESLGFLTEYMAAVQHVKTRIWQTEEDEGVVGEVLQGKGTQIQLPLQIQDHAHT